MHCSMSSLTSKEQAFIERMRRSSEMELYGFHALVQRQKVRRFFEPLRAAGFFEPPRNPAPIREPDGLRVPFWPVLQYLLAAAKNLRQGEDATLAAAILQIIRATSRAKEPDGTTRSNFQTWHVFAELFGLVPLDLVTRDDIDLVAIWLDDKVNRSLVIQAIDAEAGLLARLLASELPDDAKKAVALFDHCVRFRVIEDGATHKKMLKLDGDAYSINSLVTHRARTLGVRAEISAALSASERLRRAFATTSTHEFYSSGYRPAVEEHEQNGEWHEAENATVGALRDVLLGWCEAGSLASREFVKRLLADGIEIQRRVALFIIGAVWNGFEVSDLCSPAVFRTGHLHELYGLLKARFASLTPEQQETVVRAITASPYEDGTDLARAQFQTSLLKAVVGSGFAPANSLLTDLQARFPGLRDSGSHWDFQTYTQTRIGPGQSPYSVKELVAFATEGTLRENVEAFKEADRWSGPTIEGLVDSIKEASRTKPGELAPWLEKFRDSSHVLLHPILSGLKSAWDESTAEQSDEWDERWSCLFDCFDGLVARLEREPFDQPRPGFFLPNREWTISLVANFLLAATKSDGRVYPDIYLTRGWEILTGLLKISARVERIADDPVHEAINRPAGHVIEAMFSHALRLVRKTDREGKNHEDAWSWIKVTFEEELTRCKGSNFEMSSLSGMYLGQLLYIDPRWTDSWMPALFPSDYPTNFFCALAGTAYTSRNHLVYELLVKHGVVDAALRRGDLPGRSTKESLLGRMAVAFASSSEDLTSSRFAALFTDGQVGDIQVIANVLASVAMGANREAYRDRLIEFWSRCIEWSKTREDVPERLLASLARFSRVLDCMDDATRRLVLTVAAHVNVGFEPHGFVDSLARFVDLDPDGVLEVLKVSVAAHPPTYDYEDKLKNLLRQLASKGKRSEVIPLVDALRQVPGILDFYKRLVGGADG
jgi:hypothetical protein